MSPEQAINSDDVDARSDVFSVGAIAYLMFSARFPATPLRPIGDVTPDLPDELGNWVATAMQREREHRPDNAAALLKMLDDLV